MIIIGIKHLYDILRKVLLLYRSLIISFVKRIKLETFYRLRIPDTERIYDPVAVTDNGHIIRNRLNRLISFLNKIASAVFVDINVNISAEFYFFCVFRPSQFERIAVGKPYVRHFHLISVPDLLFEHTVTVTDPAAVSGVSQSSEGI